MRTPCQSRFAAPLAASPARPLKLQRTAFSLSLASDLGAAASAGESSLGAAPGRERPAGGGVGRRPPSSPSSDFLSSLGRALDGPLGRLEPRASVATRRRRCVFLRRVRSLPACSVCWCGVRRRQGPTRAAVLSVAEVRLACDSGVQAWASCCARLPHRSQTGPCKARRG
ncbi:Protein of unknown function [Gryllus bimaculatus]|nr:Protein of unknown function [Gryllus bimaculatus]